MANPLIVGDVHGKIAQFEQICQQNRHRPIIQLGDFGFKCQHDWLLESPYSVDVIFGNHDYYPYLDKPYSLGNFAQPFPGMFTIRGAHSIDQWARTEGRDWFADEELTYRQGMEALEAYELAKPEIVVTHDMPEAVCRVVFGYPEQNRTRQLLQSLFEIHQPRLWIHGHHHTSHTTQIEGTTFIGLAELETYSL